MILKIYSMSSRVVQSPGLSRNVAKVVVFVIYGGFFSFQVDFLASI